MKTKKKQDNTLKELRLTMGWVPIKKINPAKYNPRQDLQPGDIDYENIKRSVKLFGLVVPMVWNKRTGNLVGGHQRLKILKAKGDKRFHCSIVDLASDQEKLLNMALNKAEGDWDFNKLKKMKEEEGLSDADLMECGFEEAELEALDVFEPGAVPILPKVHMDGYGGRPIALILTFNFPNEKALQKAKEKLGLAGHKGYTFEADDYWEAFRIPKRARPPARK